LKYIDIHVHAFRFPGFPRPNNGKTFATPEQIIEQYDRLSIEKGVVLPLVSPEARKVTQSTDEVLATCNQYPSRLIPFCNIDPRFYSNSPDSPLNLMLFYYQDMGCKGIGEITANLPFNNPLVENLFKHCQYVGFPVIFHISPTIGGNYGLYDKPGLPLLEGALKKFPDLIFLGHSQAFWAEIGPVKRKSDRTGYPKGKVKKPGRVIELMRKYPNLHGDLSAGSGFNAVSRDKRFGLEFMEEFQDRLYFGTDICEPNGPTPLMDYMLKLHQSGEISEKIFKKIMRQNAIMLLDKN